MKLPMLLIVSFALVMSIQAQRPTEFQNIDWNDTVKDIKKAYPTAEREYSEIFSKETFIVKALKIHGREFSAAFLFDSAGSLSSINVYMSTQVLDMKLFDELTDRLIDQYDVVDLAFDKNIRKNHFWGIFRSAHSTIRLDIYQKGKPTAYLLTYSPRTVRR